MVVLMSESIQANTETVLGPKHNELEVADNFLGVTSHSEIEN
jgi:hypothetical protein